MAKLDLYEALARQLRADSIRCSTAAGSGHPTSSLSAADLMAVLLAGHLRYDWSKPKNPANDHLIFSKGHASPLNYALFRAAGAITDEELMTFRKLGSRLEGHPTPVLPWVDVATGSLGQGLPIAVGIALAGKRVLAAPYHVWTLTGDSELAEGSIWEGARPRRSRAPLELHRDLRRQPARAARPDRARVEPRRLRRAGEGVRLRADRDRRPRPRGDRRGARPARGTPSGRP